MSVSNIACLNSNKIRLKHAFLQEYFHCMINPVEFNTIICCNQDSHIEEHLTIVCGILAQREWITSWYFVYFRKHSNSLLCLLSWGFFPPPSVLEMQAAHGSF